MTSTATRTLVMEPPVWFITGCSTGFRREISRLAIERGFRTVVTARALSALQDFSAAENALLLELDVTKPEQVAAAMRATDARFGGVEAAGHQGDGGRAQRLPHRLGRPPRPTRPIESTRCACRHCGSSAWRSSVR